MQYKIPVQIENEDPIIFGLSLRQLSIIMAGGALAYGIFNTLAPRSGVEIALLPSGFVAAVTLAIAIFKYNEMTFIPFILSLIRFKIFPGQRFWNNGTDSFWSLDIGYLTSDTEKKGTNVDMSNKAGSLQELNEKLKNI